MKKSIFRIAALFAVAASAFAAPQVVTTVPMPAGESGPKSLVASVPVRFNGDELFALPPGAEVELALPSGRKQAYLYDRMVDHGGGIRTWIGRSAVIGENGRAIITQGPGGAWGWMRTPDAEYRLYPGEANDWLAERPPQDFTPRFPGGDAIPAPDDPPEVGPLKGIATPMSPLEQQKSLMANAAPAPGFSVDVMVLYSTDLATKLGSGLLPMIYNLIATTNQAYIDSEIALTLRLVNASPVALANTVGSSDALNAMNGSGSASALFQPLTWGAGSLRSATGADIVALVRDGPTDTGGIGFLLFNPTIYPAGPSATQTAAYSVNNYCASGCESIFAHELGHNMGNAHDRATVARDNNGTIPANSGTFAYSFGHYDCINGLTCNPNVANGCPTNYAQCANRQANDFGTIMAYVNPTVLKFSNPNLNCVPSGGAQPGRPCGAAGTADNARSMNETRHNIAAYRNQVIASLPGSLQFTNLSYSGAESGGTITFTVSRVGGTAGAVSVNWSLAPGTASAGTDYTNASGTLNWANGDGADKTFVVAIANDGVTEGIESFTATLANPAGATGVYLGYPVTAAGVILEPWPAGGVAPSGFSSASTPTLPWAVVTDSADPAGGDPASFKSGQFASSATGNSSTVFTGNFIAGTLTFAYRVSSFPNAGFFEFLVDGAVVLRDSGDNGGWESFAVAITAGSHTLEWRYRKTLTFPCANAIPGGSPPNTPPPYPNCQDRAWIDTVNLPLAGPVAVTVAKAGGGAGTVVSTPAGINCGATCTANIAAGTFLQLTPTAAAGSAFTGWSGGGGACTGTGPCFFTVGGPTTVTATFDAPSTATPRLANISTRMQVLTGSDVLIGGFIIQGTANKTVVVRARGPSLTAQSVPGALQNPVLQLFSGQTVIASNDDWAQAANAATIQSSGFAPADPRESAIHASLAPGAYTAIVTGAGGTTGVGIIEVFEVDKPEVPLANIATRGRVLTGNDVMIGGFIIQGNTPQTVVVRARGPSLTSQGVPGALANPVLQLFSGATQIASNDNWQTAGNAAAIQASGFAPTDPNEAAILITLAPGAYTAIVTGAGGTTGVGIIEVFAQ